MIYKVENYTDEEGRTVIVKNSISNDEIIREGVFAARTPMGTIRVPFEFPIEINTLEECFEKFDDFAQEKSNEIEREIQSQIVIPSSNKENGGIIIP